MVEPQTPEQILEDESGGRWHRALLMVDLQNAAEAVYEEFRYDEDDPVVVELVESCRLIGEVEVKL